ncbi:RNA polymerase sigma factor [Alienimonas californiensis]|uniref:ECF RNA polymerase sigma factor SigE n=1 Tax=Alienimonas californiensis TaxID=2527989 RepID=A0A517P503_9PLAN|nr:RNA polymerase sigma factor [Alienimonas californiensis]QDT14462.1 ECF RNA polymerase sigma factor SigE [Alienimonas californiensis]
MIAAPAARPPGSRRPDYEPALAELSDRALLVRFAERRDEAAFAELVERYGPLVAGAGRRTVHGPGGAADADDALQATFLSLARNAAKLADRMGPDRSLGGWLYRVAVNATLQAKRSDVARRRRERIVARERFGSPFDPTSPASPTAAAPRERAERNEELDALEEELAALPPAERGAVVLCHLRGRTQKEAAAELGVPFGTFRRRLDAARERLRERLEARGVTVGAAALAGWLLDAGRACGGTIHAAEAAAIAADVGRRLPPPHVLAPRAPIEPTPPGGRPVALSWEPILTAAAGLIVAALAAVGLFDLLGGGFAEEAPPPPTPTIAAPDRYDAGGMM